MGFWPYFLHAHESDGGGVSPLSRDPSTSLIGTETTFFCTARLLRIKSHNAGLLVTPSCTRILRFYRTLRNQKTLLLGHVPFWVGGGRSLAVARRIAAILGRILVVFLFVYKWVAAESAVHFREVEVGVVPTVCCVMDRINWNLKLMWW